uniref:Uncharacterized protein n=1 Tax=Oryza punctata TaxID=4537 RepID=A0A0E0K7G7_ORYPU
MASQLWLAKFETKILQKEIDNEHKNQPTEKAKSTYLNTNGPKLVHERDKEGVGDGGITIRGKEEHLITVIGGDRRWETVW